MATTALGVGGYSVPYHEISDKTPANYPAIGLLVREFDIWQQDYDGALVSVYYAGTTALMPIYSNPQMTEVLTNPQILAAKVDSLGNRYGKFVTSVYAPFSYYLDIDNSQQSGVTYPGIQSLAGHDASKSHATSLGGSRARNIDAHLADFIHMENYGVVGTSPATNTTTLNNAISAASEQGGGMVLLPAGDIPINGFNCPANVQLVGKGKGVTTLQADISTNACTFTGDTAGLISLTLDGISVRSQSVGIYGKAVDEITLINAEVKRFDVNVYWQGGRNHTYCNFDSTGGVINFRARGDVDVPGGSMGDEFSGLDWQGGEVSESTGTGVELYVRDRQVSSNNFRKIRFKDNVGTDGALNIYGAKRTSLEGCDFTGNVHHLKVKDNPDTSVDQEIRRVSGLTLYGGSFDDGQITLDGLCEDVTFDDVLLDETTFSLTTPTNSIVIRNARENDITISGEASKFLRFESRSLGAARITTTDATVSTIWRARLEPNKIIIVNALVTAEQVNGTDFAAWNYVFAARGAVATLAYDNQTNNFTVGNTIVGQTSGATAKIVADSDAGATGTLSLAEVYKVFLDNETIEESDGAGAAQVNGVLVEGSAAAIGSATEVHAVGSNTAAPPAGWTVAFAVSGQELLVQVDAASGDTVRWDAKINSTYRGW